MKPTRRTSVREKKFLAALGRRVSVGGAAIEAGLSRATAYVWRADDADFTTPSQPFLINGGGL